MKIARFVRTLLVLAALPMAAMARDSVPIIDHDDVQVVTGSGKPATAEQVRNAIVAGGQARQWTVTNGTTPGVLTATILVRNKHTAVVSIPYAADKFSIKYQNSTNLHYQVAEGASGGATDLSKVNAPNKDLRAGTPLIHPFYNRWVQDLRQSILAELRKL